MIKRLTYHNIALAIFIFINVAFCIRYAIRISYSMAILSPLTYIVIAFFVIAFSNKKQLSLKWIFSIGIIWLCACTTLLHFIPLESIRVDRIEMIELFWDAALNGEYPYNPKGTFNGNHPGPMPIYFILCYPFYLIKQYAVIPILSLIVWVLHTYKTNKANSTILTLLIITSPACYWEILCRSTIIFNTIIFLIWFVSLSKFKTFTLKQICTSAIVGGLVFSTRSTFAIPIIAFGVYSLRYNSVRNTILWCVILFFTFIVSHLPLFAYGIDNVMNLNPIWLQSNFFIPTEYMVVLVLLFVFFASKCKNFNQINFGCGIFLFSTALVYIVHYIYTTSIEHSIFFGCDLSYFLFSAPFLLLSLTPKVSLKYAT